MDNISPLAKFLQHPRRYWAVGAMCLAIVFLFVLPAWDKHQQSAKEYEDQLTKLAEIEISLAKHMGNDASGNPQDASFSTLTGIDELAAESLRETLVQQAFGLGCTTHRASLSDASRRDWYQGDHPLSTDNEHNKKKPMYEMETRELTLDVSGSLSKLSKLINEISSLDRFAFPSDMTLHREGDSSELRLDVTISLIHLLPKHD